MIRRLTRRSFLTGMGMSTIGAGLALVPATVLADEKKATPTEKEKKAPPADSGLFYQFVNNTKGKFTDEQISLSMGGERNYKSLAEAKGLPARMGGGGRIYIKMTNGKRDVH